MALVSNDAAGGAGSLEQSLLGIAVNGLSRTIDGELSERYPLTSFNQLQTYDQYGNAVPFGAPQAPVGFGGQLAALFGNPVFLAVGAAVAITLTVVALRK